jgi:hypothetical protein
VSATYKKEKKELLDKLVALDKKAEETLLDPHEIDLKCFLNNRLAQLLREEELKWYQRAKTKHFLQGDMNTKYFHLIANGKHRKTRIFQLRDNDKVVEGDEQLKKYITKYYKGLFGSPLENNFSLDELIRDNIPQVTEGENEKLTKPFCEEEVKNAIFDMEHNKAPGPNGFPKVATNKLLEVAHKVINPTQMAFLLGRNIMEEVVILHETIHKMHRKN